MSGMNKLAGYYNISIGSGVNVMEIPMVISGSPTALYAACSPKQPWHSSLTFERGVPLEFDAHGAERTLAEYIRLGTLVAFLPRSFNKLDPPWYAREFIHTCHNSQTLVPQPAYAKEPIYRVLLHNAVDTALFNNFYNREWGYCGCKYDKVYVDVGLSPALSPDVVGQFYNAWKTRKFVTRV